MGLFMARIWLLVFTCSQFQIKNQFSYHCTGSMCYCKTHLLDNHTNTTLTSVIILGDIEVLHFIIQMCSLGFALLWHVNYHYWFVSMTWCSICMYKECYKIILLSVFSLCWKRSELYCWYFMTKVMHFTTDISVFLIIILFNHLRSNKLKQSALHGIKLMSADLFLTRKWDSDMIIFYSSPITHQFSMCIIHTDINLFY